MFNKISVLSALMLAPALAFAQAAPGPGCFDDPIKEIVVCPPTPTTSVPEPATLGLLSLGLAGVALARRRRPR